MEKINKLSIPATIIISSIILGGFYYFTQSNKQKSNDIDLNIQCAKQAKTFYDWYSEDAVTSSLAYENHFNKKLNKCFILVYGAPSASDIANIDLYDAVEKKHYAMYLGHNYCSKSSLFVENNLKKCEFDSGSIWSNGIDSTEPDIITKQPGGEQTKTEFFNLIQSLFMKD